MQHFGRTFQYVCEVNGRFYQEHFQLTPGWKMWLMRMLGKTDFLFTVEEIKDATDVLINGAARTIDEINDPAKRRERKAERLRIRERRKKLRESGCFWQGRKNEQGEDIFYCLIHGEESLVPE